MEQITLDLIPKGSLPVLHASQYDDGRQWKVNLKENGEDYTLSNETIVLDVRKGDGCAVTCAVAVESGKKYVILTSTEQMCAVAGQNLAELQITKGDMKIGTLNFILQVERDPLDGSISSSSEIHDLQHQVDECVDSALADLGASGLPYDNTESGLEATNVQQAIDEVNEKASDIASELDDKADKSNTYTKSEVNDIADTKADANNVYAKSETYTKTEVDTLIRNLPEPMIFKGTLGVGGTITELPTASTSNEGYTYKVITEGTYAGTSAKVGDVFVSDGSTWVLIPAGDEDNDTWRAIKVNGVEKLGNAISSGSVDFVDTTNVKFEFDSNGNTVKATLSGIDTSSEVDAKVAGLIDDESTTNNKTWSSNKISAELVSLLPVDEASGGVANFDTDVVLPLIDVKSEIKAVETGTGAKSPSNPYVISGFSAVSIKHSGSDMTDYDEYIINLGGTYYGGYVEQDKDGKRELVDTYSNLVNLPDLTFYPTTKGGHICFYADLPNGVIKSGGEQAFSGKCSTYTVTSNLTMPNDLTCLFYCSELYGGYTRILIRDDSASTMTGAQFAAYVTGQTVYEKASPQTIDLSDGELITAFNGINNVWSDTNGDTTVKYKLGIQAYIDKKIAEVQALVL